MAKPKWVWFEGTFRLLKGKYVRTSTGRYVKVTKKLLISGNIIRNASGGAILYNKDHTLAGSISVEYNKKNKPILLRYKGKLLAVRNER